jgi:hypothetical protein
MSLLMADTTLIDQVLDDALRALEHLSEMAHVTDLGCDPCEDAVVHRLDAATPEPSPLTWLHHLVTTR